MEFGCVADTNVWRTKDPSQSLQSTKACNHLPLCRVTAHATQAAQHTIWVLVIQTGEQHPASEQCLETLGQQSAGKVPRASHPSSRTTTSTDTDLAGGP